jgi:hypothetical protein
MVPSVVENMLRLPVERRPVSAAIPMVKYVPQLVPMIALMRLGYTWTAPQKRFTITTMQPTKIERTAMDEEIGMTML